MKCFKWQCFLFACFGFWMIVSYQHRGDRQESPQIAQIEVSNNGIISDGCTSLEVDNEANLIRYSELADTNVHVIKLETTPQSLIGRINKIVVQGEYIFVADTEISKALFIFDRKGKFLGKIGARGEGPTEYYDIQDFTIDIDQGKIILLDLTGRKLNFYTLEGRFLHSKTIPFLFSGIESLDHRTWVLASQGAYNGHMPDIDGYSLIVCDTNFNIQAMHFPSDPKQRDFSYYNQRQLRKFGEHDFYYYDKESIVTYVTPPELLLPLTVLPEDSPEKDLLFSKFNGYSDYDNPYLLVYKIL